MEEVKGVMLEIGVHAEQQSSCIITFRLHPVSAAHPSLQGQVQILVRPWAALARVDVPPRDRHSPWTKITQSPTYPVRHTSGTAFTL
jgi:hypothetical protein